MVPLNYKRNSQWCYFHVSKKEKKWVESKKKKTNIAIMSEQKKNFKSVGEKITGIFFIMQYLLK